MGQLEGKTAIITGGGTGIGKAIAARFHAEGAAVAICGRRAAVLAQAAADIAPDGTRIMHQVLDVGRPADIAAFMNAVAERFSRVDILVNNAGIMRFGSLAESTEELWSTIMDINLLGPWRMMNAAVPYMRRQGGGSIVNISSIAGHKAFAGTGVYCTSKAALVMMSQVAALELAADRIRVNLIAPGLVEDTELANPIVGVDGLPAFYERLRSLHPLGRCGKPQDAADAALFLASDQSSWISGVLLPLDGGRHLATNRPTL
jgi:NAD(P)-dependent dehydrogenase (short-subunit alcohol dehydrogenase family)